MEKISVIIPCRNEGKYITGCLESIIKNDYAHEDIEIFFVDGSSADNTREIIEKYAKQFSFIHLLLNKKKTVPYALNMGIEKSSGDYIIRLDAHGEIPSNYFSKLIKWSKELNADNIGAGWITDVKNKNPKTIAIKKVLSNKYGVGNSYFRTGINEIKEVDTVPFGCFRKDVFQKVGLFDNRLTRNQDIELNKRIKRKDGKIYLLPHLFSNYFARETYFDIAKNNFQTGLYNILTVYFTKRFSSLSLRHFIPLVFILSLVLPLLVMFWIPYSGLISLVIFSLYLIIITVISVSIKDRTTTIRHILLAFMTLHFSYGFGSLIGIFKINALFQKSEND